MIHGPQPEPISSNTLFHSQPAESAGETLRSMFQSLRETISQKTATSPSPCSCSRKGSASPSTQIRASPSSAQDGAEIERLQAVIDKLRADLGTLPPLVCDARLTH